VLYRMNELRGKCSACARAVLPLSSNIPVMVTYLDVAVKMVEGTSRQPGFQIRVFPQKPSSSARDTPHALRSLIFHNTPVKNEWSYVSVDTSTIGSSTPEARHQNSSPLCIEDSLANFLTLYSSSKIPQYLLLAPNLELSPSTAHRVRGFQTDLEAQS
jgi:hypothetical protein